MKKATFFLTLCLALFCWTGIASAQGVVSRDGWRLSSPAAPTTAIEGAGDGRIAAAIDGKESTYYHSDWTGSKVGESLPQYFIIDTGESGVSGINGFAYLPRPNNGNGTSKKMRVYFSNTAFDLSGGVRASDLTGYTLAAEATFEYGNTTDYKYFDFSEAQSGRYVLVVSDESKSGSYFTCAEFYLYGSKIDMVKYLGVQKMENFKNYSSLTALGFTEDYYTNAVNAINAVTTDDEAYETTIYNLATTAVNNIKRVLQTGKHVVTFTNQDTAEPRSGMKITAGSAAGYLYQALGTQETSDITKWVLKVNSDGTFKLYNQAWNVYLGDANGNAKLSTNSSDGANYQFVVVDRSNSVVNLKDASGNILHQKNNSPYGYMAYNATDVASNWKMEAATLTEAVNERMWNDLNALYTTEKNRAYSYYQENYGLVKSGENIQVVVNHASGGDHQPSSNLLDGNASTYVHSSYGSDAGSDPHYIQVTLSEPKDKVMFYMHRRENSSNNNRPKTIKVYTSTDGRNFSAEPVATLDNLEGRSSVASYYSPEIDLGGSYQYLRFVVTATNSGTQFFTASEFYVLPINEETSKLATMASVTPANIKERLISLVGPQPISSASELSSAKVYTIAPEEYSTRGVLYAPAGASQLTSCGGSASNAANQGVAVDANSTAQQFAFVQANEKYYLYSVSEKKFVTNNSSRAKINYTPADYVTIEASDKEEYFIIKFNGSNFLNIANGYGDNDAAVTHWNYIDGGNRMRITPVGDLAVENLADFAAACLDLKAALSGVKSGELIGSGLGQYTASVENYATISNTAHSFYNSITNETAVADITAQKVAVAPLADATVTLNMPVAGKFYRFKGTSSNNYMVSTLSETGGKTNQLGMNAANNTRESVFYYDGTNLVAYANGLCVG
ncbi:discoidin domain-containing protein, partial [bacterium]|nr:discoidin domain-containing protein [bacterium]